MSIKPFKSPFTISPSCHYLLVIDLHISLLLSHSVPDYLLSVFWFSIMISPDFPQACVIFQGGRNAFVPFTRRPPVQLRSEHKQPVSSGVLWTIWEECLSWNHYHLSSPLKKKKKKNLEKVLELCVTLWNKEGNKMCSEQYSWSSLYSSDFCREP